MFANLRTIWEITAAAGMAPEIAFDSDSSSPPTYVNLVQRGEATAVVAAAAVDQEFVIPVDACAVLVYSDVAIKVRLAAGETQMEVRNLLIGGSEEGSVAFPAGSILVSGVDAAANVRVYYAATVT